MRVVHGDSSYDGHVDGLAEEDVLRVAASVAEGLRGEPSRPAALSAAERAAGHAIEIRPEEVAAARKAEPAAGLRRTPRDAGSEAGRRCESATPSRGVRSRSTTRSAAPPSTTAPACELARRWWRAGTVAWKPAPTRAAATPDGS